MAVHPIGPLRDIDTLDAATNRNCATGSRLPPPCWFQPRVISAQLSHARIIVGGPGPKLRTLHYHDFLPKEKIRSMCAPVKRGVAHRYVDGLVLFSGSAKRFSSPWIPINGVFGVPKIRGVFRDSRFGMCLPEIYPAR